MPRLTDQIIFQRIQQAMTPPIQATQQGALPQTIESLIQKAKEKRGSTSVITPKPKGL